VKEVTEIVLKLLSIIEAIRAVVLDKVFAKKSVKRLKTGKYSISLLRLFLQK
jgi:hypothetical protein